MVDYVIIDTPLNINTVINLAIKHSNKVIIPFDLNYYSIIRIISLLKKYKAQNREYLLLPTKVKNNKTYLNNLKNIKELLNINSLKNIHILNTKLSFNNMSSLIVQEQHVPQVLTMNKLKLNKKYIDKYIRIN